MLNRIFFETVGTSFSTNRKVSDVVELSEKGNSCIQVLFEFEGRGIPLGIEEYD